MSAATVSQAYLPNTGSAYTQRYGDVRPRANAWRHRFHLRTSKSNRCRTPVRSNGISDKPPGFFETFILRPNQPDYREFDPTLNYLINSY